MWKHFSYFFTLMVQVFFVAFQTQKAAVKIFLFAMNLLLVKWSLTQMFNELLIYRDPTDFNVRNPVPFPTKIRKKHWRHKN